MLEIKNIYVEMCLEDSKKKLQDARQPTRVHPFRTTCRSPRKRNRSSGAFLITRAWRSVRTLAFHNVRAVPDSTFM